MNSSEKFRRYILDQQKHTPGEKRHYQFGALAGQLEISQQDIQGMIVEMVDEQLVSLSAWNGQEDLDFSYWDPKEFFASTLDHSHKRVLVLTKGIELSELMSKSNLGFVPSN
jgi:hypothetical protein